MIGYFAVCHSMTLFSVNRILFPMLKDILGFAMYGFDTILMLHITHRIEVFQYS